jgi:hypothetical protein
MARERFAAMAVVLLAACYGSSALAADVPGNNRTRAALSVGRDVAGVLESRTDKDWFRTTLQAGRRYEFYVVPRAGGRSLTSGRVRIISAASRAAVASGTRPSHTPRGTGVFYIEVAGAGGSYGNYTVKSAAAAAPTPPTPPTPSPDPPPVIRGDLDSIDRPQFFSRTLDIDTYDVELSGGMTYTFSLRAGHPLYPLAGQTELLLHLDTLLPDGSVGARLGSRQTVQPTLEPGAPEPDWTTLPYRTYFDASIPSTGTYRITVQDNATVPIFGAIQPGAQYEVEIVLR